MVKYGKVIENALRFSVQPQRWLPFFVLDVVIISLALMYLISNITVLQSLSGMQGFQVFSSIAGALSVFVILFVVWFLGRLYISGAVIHQSVKPKQFDKSWDVSKKRFFSLLAVTIVVSLLSVIVGSIPHIGWIFSLIVSIAFFFSVPMTVAGKMSFDKALPASYNLFRKKPFETFLAWLLTAIIAGLIFIVLALPLFAAAWTTFIPTLAGMSGAGPAQILQMIVTKGWTIVPALIILMIGMSISTTFGLFAQTHFYNQLHKRRLF